MTDPIATIKAAPSSRLDVRVAVDGMIAFAGVAAGSPRGSAELDDALKAAGIVHGVDEAAYTALVRALASEEPGATQYAIARGSAPGASRPGSFEPAFQQGPQAGHVREDGTMDFHDRDLLKPVATGEVLGRLLPPVQGAAGVRVDGRTIPAAAAPALAFSVGKGAESLADGRVVATCAGVIIYVEGRSIEIGTRYVHEADVDLRSGDLSMEGSLVVRSDVQRGFLARATGDLEIKGGIDGGSAYAGANITVFGGVRGSEGSMVSAGGDLRAHHVERARLDCGGVLAVNDAVNSEISAVHVRIERSLRGGHAAVEIGLTTRDAGTANASAETTIEAGVPREEPEADARSALEAAKTERVFTRRMSDLRGSAGERAKGGRLARELAGLHHGAIARKIDRAERVQALLPRAFVEVRGVAHAGVHVRIGAARLQLKNPMRHVRFTLDLERQTIRMEVVKT